MSVNIKVDIRIPINSEDEKFKKYFLSTNYYDFWKPTKEYLKVLCQKNAKESKQVVVYSNDFEQMTILKNEEDVYNFFYDRYEKFLIKLVKEDNYIKRKEYIIFSDSFSVNGGDTVIDPYLISSLFPELEIEFRNAIEPMTDEDYAYSIWKNGKKIKEDVKCEECELGRFFQNANNCKMRNHSATNSVINKTEGTSTDDGLPW